MGAGLMSGMKGGRKLKRSGKDRAYYERQFVRTAANKARRATKRRKSKEHWAAVKAAEQAKAV